MKVNPNSILPSQDFLKPGTVGFIADCIKNNTPEALPPDPIVRADGAGRLIAIDGHNLIAYMAYLQQPIEVHLAESATDGLPGISGADIARNTDLLNKYDSVLTDQTDVAANGIESFSDLMAKYPELFPA